MDDAKTLYNHLKSTLSDIEDKDLEELVNDIVDMREDFKVRYASIIQFAEIFTGAQITVELENHSSFPRAVVVEDLASGKSLGKIFFSPWQRKPVNLTTYAGGFARMKLSYLLTRATETTRFMRDGEVFRIMRPRIPLAGS